MEDAEIIVLLFERSEDGLVQLQKKYGSTLEAVSMAILNNRTDAEECVNDLYLKIWNIIPPYSPRYLKAFLCKLVRQISIDRYRKRKRERAGSEYLLSLSELTEIPVAEAPETDDGELKEHFNRFMSTLHEEDRVLFVRRYYLCESPDDLAERFGMSRSLVNVRLYRIRKSLRAFLEKEGYRFV